MWRWMLFVVIIMVSACRSSKEVVYTVPYEEMILDTLTVTAPAAIQIEPNTEAKTVYRPSAERNYDILHTKLAVAFDWEDEHVLGKAWIDVKPMFYPIKHIQLDAKNFLIHAVENKVGTPLTFDYDGRLLRVNLDKEYTRKDTFQIYVDYTARPSEGAAEGSDAITSDKGLFFINADNKVKNKPRQIWTQGQSEHNSKWFPTFDKPNERCTQELLLTVEKDLQTLSNGKLISSTDNGDGTKTDYWKMDQPHAPYLFMLAVGDFARVKDQWRHVPLEYMVDPPYKQDAKKIFNHTPEMMTFFSDVLDYPYPWNKYSQVVVEDYVAGAMENTTAVTFGDFVQKTSRELIDNHNDKIVAHELFHHWFGDLVTCESWANLTLNEGFANYSEYLWFEHKYGKDEADRHKEEELNTYLFTVAQDQPHDLIHYTYHDAEDMFDVHSYNKGGLVLHMLRNYIGDEAFFAALHKYLHDNKYTAVEVDELRMAFEDVTGQDLHWFFDQWYLDKGHPVVTFDTKYNAKEKTLTLYTEQIQDINTNRATFRILTDVALIDDRGNTTYHEAVIEGRKDSIVLDGIHKTPKAILLDGKDYNLMEVSHDFSEDQLTHVVKHSTQWKHKMHAVNALLSSEKLVDLVPLLLREKHYTLRQKGIDAAHTKGHFRTLEKMAMNDPHSKVRAAALTKYAELYSAKAVSLSKTILDKNEAPYAMIKSALNVLHDHDRPAALSYAKKLADDPSIELVPVLSSLLAETGDINYLPYIEKNLDRVNIYQVFNLYGAYSKLLLLQDVPSMLSAIDRLKATSLNDKSIYKRYMATDTIEKVKQKLEQVQSVSPSDEQKRQIEKIEDILTEIKSVEKNKDLINRYGSY